MRPATWCVLLGCCGSLSCGSDEEDAEGVYQYGAAGAGTVGSAGASGSSAGARQLCVDLTNQYRQGVGAPPLQRFEAQEPCCDSEAESDATSGKAHGAFGTCGESAQNECPGRSTLDQTVQTCLQMFFAEGPGEPYSAHGHYINMTNTAYTKVACGFFQTKGGSYWMVQNFW